MGAPSSQARNSEKTMAAKSKSYPQGTLESRLTQCRGLAAMVAEAHEGESSPPPDVTRDAMWAMEALLDQAQEAFRQMCAAKVAK